MGGWYNFKKGLMVIKCWGCGIYIPMGDFITQVMTKSPEEREGFKFIFKEEHAKNHV